MAWVVWKAILNHPQKSIFEWDPAAPHRDFLSKILIAQNICPILAGLIHEHGLFEFCVALSNFSKQHTSNHPNKPIIRYVVKNQNNHSEDTCIGQGPTCCLNEWCPPKGGRHDKTGNSLLIEPCSIFFVRSRRLRQVQCTDSKQTIDAFVRKTFSYVIEVVIMVTDRCVFVSKRTVFFKWTWVVKLPW